MNLFLSYINTMKLLIIVCLVTLINAQRPAARIQGLLNRLNSNISRQLRCILEKSRQQQGLASGSNHLTNRLLGRSSIDCDDITPGHSTVTSRSRFTVPVRTSATSMLTTDRVSEPKTQTPMTNSILTTTSSNQVSSSTTTGASSAVKPETTALRAATNTPTSTAHARSTASQRQETRDISQSTVAVENGDFPKSSVIRNISSTQSSTALSPPADRTITAAITEQLISTDTQTGEPTFTTNRSKSPTPFQSNTSSKLSSTITLATSNLSVSSTGTQLPVPDNVSELINDESDIPVIFPSTLTEPKTATSFSTPTVTVPPITSSQQAVTTQQTATATRRTGTITRQTATSNSTASLSQRTNPLSQILTTLRRPATTPSTPTTLRNMSDPPIPTKNEVKTLKSLLHRAIKENEFRLPAWVQMGFHHCVGGCDGCLDFSKQDNKGLVERYRKIRELHSNHSDIIGLADFVTLAAVVAAEAGIQRGVEGHTTRVIPVKFGRKTCSDPDKPTKISNFPDGSDPKAVNTLMNEFNITLQEAIALMGAHSLGRCRAENSGFAGPWDFSPFKLERGYWLGMLLTNWSIGPSVNGRFQWNSPAFTRMMLSADIGLLRNITVTGENHRPSCFFANQCSTNSNKPQIDGYARNITLFHDDFVEVYQKMLEKTNSSLHDPI